MHKKRKHIEIYFILYLAAIILLLPDFKDKINYVSDAENVDIPFQISLDKSTLTCKMHKTGTQSDILSLDSVNKIYWRGDVRNVNIEFIIEDLTKRLDVSLNKNNRTTKLFRMQENSSEQNIDFVWNPGNNELLNKTYVVKIIAKAISNKTNTPITIKSQFSLNLFFDDEVPVFGASSSTTGDGTSTSNPQNTQGINQGLPQNFVGNIDLQPEDYIIRTVSYSQWQNSIRVYGLDVRTDLLKNPVLKYNGKSGNAYIAEIKDHQILLKGSVSGQENLTVTVVLTSKYDKKEYSCDFIIKPNSLGDPIFDKVMYPFKNYRVIPNFPEKITQRPKTLLREANSGQIINQTLGNAELFFAPNIADTNKVLALERYIENELVGERYKIYIRNYPAPEILSVDKKNESTLIVKTRSYGYWAKGKKNYVKTIYVNASSEIKELFASMKDDNDVYFQTFEIKLNSLSNIRLQAIDSRNIVSSLVKYP